MSTFQQANSWRTLFSPQEHSWQLVGMGESREQQLQPLLALSVEVPSVSLGLLLLTPGGHLPPKSISVQSHSKWCLCGYGNPVRPRR